ncbi:MAG TPA: hypothetical protein VHC49_21625 [Mycobacteriales bacterium]|nr:hypothetical protein [Mycobacteriales bacterium]
MTFPEGPRKAAETAVKTPFYACIGLGDLALSRATSIPGEARAIAKSLPDEARSRVKNLQQVLSPTAVRTVADIYADQAGHALTHFAKRGEQVVARVRRAPEARAAEAKVESAFDRVDDVTDEVTEQIAETEAKATTAARKSARSATARKSAPAKSSPAKKATQTTKATNSKKA